MRSKQDIFAHPLRTLNEDQIKSVSGGKGNFSQDNQVKAMDRENQGPPGGG